MLSGTARCSGIHTDSYPRASAFCATCTNSSGRAVEPLPTPVRANFISPPLFYRPVEGISSCSLMRNPLCVQPGCAISAEARGHGMDYPKLRPIEAFPVEGEGETRIYLRDPLNYTKSQLMVSYPIYFIISQLDGRHSLLDIQEAFARQFGQVLPATRSAKSLASLTSITSLTANASLNSSKRPSTPSTARRCARWRTPTPAIRLRPRNSPNKRRRSSAGRRGQGCPLWADSHTRRCAVSSPRTSIYGSAARAMPGPT